MLLGLVLAGVEVVFPGAGVVGVVLWGVVGVVVVGVELAGGTMGVLVTVGVVGVVGERAAGDVVVMVVVVGGLPGPESPASFTSAAASTPSESTATTIAPSSGAFQAGDAASRVRAAAPQRRHHSCSACSGAPHKGQVAPGALGGVVGATVPPGPPPGAVATLTCPLLPGG